MMPKPKLFLYFFLFVVGSCQRQTIEVKNQNADIFEFYYLDSLSSEDKLNGLNRLLGGKNPIQTDSIYFEALNKKSLLHYKLQDYDSFYKGNSLLFQKAALYKNKYFEGKSAFNLAYYYDELSPKYDSAFYYYNISKNAFLKHGDTISSGKKLLSMGIIQKNQSDFFGAKESLTEAVAYLSLSDDKKFLASAYNVLGTAHQKLLNFDDALKYYQKAISTSDNPIDIVIYMNDLALHYAEQGNFIEAEKILSEIIRDLPEKGESRTFARMLHNLTYFQWKNGKSEVIKSFLQAKEIRLRQNDLRGLITSHFDLAEFYMLSNPNLAKQYLDTSIAMAKQIKMPSGELNALRRFVVLKPQDLEKRDRLTFLIDSLHRQELNAKTQFAKMRYDDEQEKARLLALETETAQKELQFARQETQKILLLSLSAVLLMGAISSYFLLRQRHKKEKLKEVYNTEKRISQDLHDGLGNSVFGLMAKLQTQKVTNKEVLDDLDKIYRTTRTISHDNAAINTQDFNAELKNLIDSYRLNGTTIVTNGLSKIEWSKFETSKQIVVHRAINELLVNMIKHAKASLVSLQFGIDKKTLVITYGDNGVGVDTTKPKGIGLKNTENRIRAVGGQFKFESKDMNGVKATVSIPV